MFLPHLKLSNEEIHYKGKYSSFALDLIVFFDKFMKDRDEQISKDIPQKKIIDDITKKFKSSNETNNLINIIKKHSGLECEIKPSSTSELSGYFATTVFTNQDNISFKDNFKVKNNIDDLNIENKIKKIFDKKEGKLIGTDDDIIKGKIILFFCINTAFFINFYNSNFSNLTAEELSAIILHEIGHNITALEHTNRLRDNLDELLQPIKININSVNEAKQVLKITKENIKYFNKNSNNKELIKKNKMYEKVIDNLDKCLDKDFVVNKSKWVFILIVPIVCVLITGMILTSILTNTILGLAISSIEKKPKNKKSDFNITFINNSDIEYQSDKYVIMHGLGPSLQLAISKVIDASLLLRSNYKDKARDSLISYNINSLLFSINNLLFGKYHNRLYGTPLQRLDNTKKTLLSSMRAEDIPKDIMDYMIKEYEIYKKLMDKLEDKYNKTIARNHKLYSTINKFINIGYLIEFISKGSNSGDYQIIMQSAKYLMSSELIYYVKKMEQQGTV
jgi:hypothetical protein